jgi:hypothetical protein
VKLDQSVEVVERELEGVFHEGVHAERVGAGVEGRGRRRPRTWQAPANQVPSPLANSKETKSARLQSVPRAVISPRF